MPHGVAPAVRRALALGGLALAWAGPLRAQTEITVESYLGSAVSLPTPLTITQKGQPDLHFTAHYQTRPWDDTWYYQGRIGIWKGDRGWLLEFLHHKLYLTEDRPDEIQQFQITNGFTMFTVSRGWRWHNTILAAGAGPVITYPISTVRGLHEGGRGGFLGGYHLSGGTIIGTVAQRVPILPWLFVAGELRGSVSYVRVPVALGHASVPNVALHYHLGGGIVLP